LIDRLLQIPRSHVLQNILPSIAWCSSVAGLLTLYMQAYDAHVLPDGFPSFSPNNACTSFVNTTTVALSLLLVFRTNVSYGRWDEARKMKGLLVNRSRDLMRQACAMLPAEDIETKAMMAKWTAAFCRVLRIHFQPEVSLEDEMKGLLSPEELQWLQESKHRPCSVIHVLSQIIYDSQISAICQAQMCNNLTAFEDVLGGCERLLRAPIPVSYTRHTARFLFTWLTLLPFALYASCGVWTLPVVAGVSAVLCGIEEIGVQIEEPFGILPLEAICGRIQADVMATLREDEKTRNLRRKVIQSRQLELRELASGSPSK
jgi:putative membrane protein